MSSLKILHKKIKNLSKKLLNFSNSIRYIDCKVQGVHNCLIRIPHGCGITKTIIQGGIPNENSTQHFSFKHTP